MKLRFGALLGQCPHCGSLEFLPGPDGSPELVCAACGHRASRAALLERLAEKAAELGRLTLERLKTERRRRRRT